MASSKGLGKGKRGGSGGGGSGAGAGAGGGGGDEGPPVGIDKQRPVMPDASPTGLIFVEVPRDAPKTLSQFGADHFLTAASSIEDMRQLAALLEHSPSRWDRVLARTLADRTLPDVEANASRVQKQRARSARSQRQLGGLVLVPAPVYEAAAHFHNTRRAARRAVSYAEAATDDDDDDTDE